MKKIYLIAIALILVLLSGKSFSQPDDLRSFKMKSTKQVTIAIHKVVESSVEMAPFTQGTGGIYGLSVTGKVTFAGDGGLLRIILADNQGQEYLVYEMYSLLTESQEVAFIHVCEETSLLENINPTLIKIDLKDASLQLDELTLGTDLPPGMNVALVKRENHRSQNEAKISKLNQNLPKRGLLWRAGNTEVSSLSYAEKKLLYGQSKFPAGMEFYCGGILQAGVPLKGATASLMVDKWDWRNRHGKFWISPVKNQANCGSCWAFAATGATEAQVNLYFNQLLNLDLSEQDVLSCSGAGTCRGGWPDVALNYIASTGIVDEAAFPYWATDRLCSEKSSNPSHLIKIAGKVDFGTTPWPREEDALKKMIIKYGPISGGIYDWSHAIVLVGWQVVKEGDEFFTRDLNLETKWITVPAGSPLIGTTVWIFKNSWGSGWGDAGYVYVQTSIENVGWTHALLNPVQSLKQTYTVSWADGDGDGYYWWGLGTKPAACPGPSTPDGDDSDASLGPLDSYGNCIVLGGTPVANFTSDKTSLNEAGTVAFTDQSTNAPSSWSWSFEGGTPSFSAAQNPVVTYNTAGTYDVSLTVANANGTSSKTITDYITVIQYVPAYCASNGNATREWISKVVLNGITSASAITSGVYGYQDFISDPNRLFTVNRGTSYSISLTPSFSSKTASAESFSVWIDYNQDKDFSDAGEQVCTASKIKTTVTKTITIPGTVPTGPTRMRISMKRNAFPLPCEIFTTGEVEDYTIQIGPVGSKNASGEFSEDFRQGKINIYPNPAREKLTVELGEFFDGDKLQICNIQGMCIVQKQLNDQRTILDISGVSPGIYFIEVFNGSQQFREKFIKY